MRSTVRPVPRRRAPVPSRAGSGAAGLALAALLAVGTMSPAVAASDDGVEPPPGGVASSTAPESVVPPTGPPSAMPPSGAPSAVPTGSPQAVPLSDGSSPPSAPVAPGEPEERGGVEQSDGERAAALIVTRIAGVDRYDGAARVSERMFPAGADRVYVASGENYPDALSAGPAAVRQDAPLLLVQAGAVPAATAAEIRRLEPKELVIVGGTSSVSAATAAALKKLLPAGAVASRISGADRYAVSRELATRSFPSAIQAYVATGASFPDALVASAVAGSARAPIVLIDGAASFADAPTLDLFRSLRTTTIAIAGGRTSVSAGVEASLKTVATVSRSFGADRYSGSIAFSRDSFVMADTIYLATGATYPDALVGGVMAGRDYAPLLLVPGTCVPKGVLDEAVRLKAKNVVLLGGLGSLTAEVEALKPCL